MCGFLICGLKGEAGEGGGFSSTQGESSVDISKKISSVMCFYLLQTRTG